MTHLLRNTLLIGLGLTTLGLSLPAHASLRGRLSEASDLLESGEASQALEAYESLTTDYPEEPRVTFGRGCAEYRLGTAALEAQDIEEARTHLAAAQGHFNSLLAEADRKLARDAAFNRANCMLQNIALQMAGGQAKGEEIKQSYEKVIQSYQQVLREFPDFKPARHNMNHARLMMKQQLKPTTLFVDWGTDLEDARATAEGNAVRLIQEDTP
jgi:tetratricopeptide (TPR) repeat protein